MLSDIRILQELDRGNIIINPFDKTQLGTNSYDVRLGKWYFASRCDASPGGRESPTGYALDVVDITQERDVRGYWGTPRRAWSDFSGRQVLTIPAGATFLCHTQEVVGGRNGITSDMRARSSIGRSGISVCKCAGIGDVGYIGRWTMELTNHSAATVVIPVGLRVAQILFHEVGETSQRYEGKYGSWAESGFDDWDPEDMLPKLWLDKDKDRWG